MKFNPLMLSSIARLSIMALPLGIMWATVVLAN